MYRYRLLSLPLFFYLSVFCALLAIPSISSAQTYDAASQFASVNPNGVWSYGGSDSLGSPFILDTSFSASVNGTTLEAWEGVASGVFYNDSNSVLTHPPGSPTEVWQPGALGLQSDASGQIDVVRFTAPIGGTYSVSATYYPIDSLATTDVHVLVNSISVFDSAFSGSGPNVSYGPTSYTLNTGDTVDFACGDGGNGDGSDRTGVSATINTLSVDAPTINGFSPTRGPIGTVVTVNGANLSEVTAVRFHNASAKVFSSNAAGTQLTVIVPTGSGTGTITVTTPGGSVKTATAFTVVPPPAITSFAPTSGPVGTVVTVTGANFGGVTAVRFHNANATTFSANAAGTQLTVTVPSGAATGTFTVTTPGGSVKTTSTFTILVPPTVTSFTPTSGPVGTVVTITGTNLGGVTAVRFHNANASMFSANAQGTQITVTVPSGAATGTFTVTTQGGSIKTTGTFTIAP